MYPDPKLVHLKNIPGFYFSEDHRRSWHIIADHRRSLQIIADHRRPPSQNTAEAPYHWVVFIFTERSLDSMVTFIHRFCKCHNLQFVYINLLLGSEQKFKPTADWAQKLRKLLYSKMTDPKDEFAKIPYLVVRSIMAEFGVSNNNNRELKNGSFWKGKGCYA